MEFVLSTINCNTFLFLALLHLFWVFGGEWGFAVALPTDINGRRVLNPSRLTTFFVAMVLSFFMLINLSFIGILQLPFYTKYVHYCMVGISCIFFLRFIGDLKYVGIFKKYRHSKFASRDTCIYSPLCLLLSISHAILSVYFADEI